MTTKLTTDPTQALFDGLWTSDAYWRFHNPKRQAPEARFRRMAEALAKRLDELGYTLSGPSYCHCGHTRVMHDEDNGDCNDEVWDGEGHGFCGCEKWRVDPRRFAPVAGSIGQ